MAGYHYPKSVERAQFTAIVAGYGLVSAQGLYSFLCLQIVHRNYTGQDHHRQRKIISPAFSTAQVQSYLPLFHRTASKV